MMFFPKFHCELNFIEIVWGYLKASLRKHCTFNFKDLKLRLPATLRLIPTTFFKRAHRHCLRFMSGYRRGLEGPLLDYIVKKYKNHRAISDNMVIINQLKEEYKKKEELKYAKKNLKK